MAQLSLTRAVVIPYTTLFRSPFRTMYSRLGSPSLTRILTETRPIPGILSSFCSASVDVRQSNRFLENSKSSFWLLSSRSEEHTSELQSLAYLVCRLLLENTKS